MKIYLESKEGGGGFGFVIEGCNVLLGQKFANTCSFEGRRIIVQQEKSFENKTQLDEPVEWSSGGDPLLHIKFCIYRFSLSYGFFLNSR